MRTTIFVLLFVLWTSSVVAQQHTGGGVYYIGGKSQVAISGMQSAETRRSFQIGGMVQFWSKSERNALRVGLQYSRVRGIGFYEEPDIIYPGFPPIYGENYTFRFNNTYLMFPVEYVGDLNRKPGGFYFVGGPALCFVTSRELVRTPAYSNNDEPEFKPVELWANVGFGYRFKTKDKISIYVQPMLSVNYPSVAMGVASSFTNRNGDKQLQEVEVYGLFLGICAD